MSSERRQVLRFLFLKLDAAWRRLTAREQAAQKDEFGTRINGFRGRLLLRSFSLSGTRGDADLLLWQVADNLETLHALQTAIFSTALGGYLTVAHSFLAMTHRSSYELAGDEGRERPVTMRPQDSRYLFVYPFVKTREWYALPKERRQQMMEEHIRTGRKYPALRLNTGFSFGLDDQEFVLAFEGDDPGEFLDLVMELRETEASAFTLRDTPIFTCIQMSLWDVLDSLGGATVVEPAVRSNGAIGFVSVARVPDVPAGSAKRVYCGSDAVALFNVGGRFFALSDRCTHGRGSLSEGTVDAASCVLTCPWHGGSFDLATGAPLAAPARMPVRSYPVKVDGDDVLLLPVAS